MAQLPEGMQDFQQREFAVVRGFYPRPLIDNYRSFLVAALDREVRAIFDQVGLDLDMDDLGARVSDFIAAQSNMDPSVRQILLGHFPLAVRLSNAINQIARHLGMSALLRSICGAESLFMHMPPMARFVPPGYLPAAVPAHQDCSYNTHMTEFVTVWTPLVDIDERCGGLVVYEGSHRHREAVSETVSGWLAAVNASGYPATQLIDLQPGDAVLLSPRIVHASAPNTSDRVRLSLDLRVFGPLASSTKHHMNLATLEVVPPSEGA